jgi:ubiquinone/menaquinone biosynthesis C-methylase UbiE
MKHLKAKMRASWIAGDFGKIAQYSAKSAEEFVRRRNVQPGMRVLDVACGTGNLAIPAARAGASVTGIDIAPNLLEQARTRAAAEDLKCDFREGDAEQLPLPDGEYDLVMSMFGAMFGPRPELVASELARVCRPGGTIAMANWTAEGFIGDFIRVSAAYVPPPEGIPAPVLWGSESFVRERFAKYASHVETVRRMLYFDFAFPPREVVRFYREHFGPTLMTFARLDEAGQAALASDMEKLWASANQEGSGRTVVPAEYLEVVVQVRQQKTGAGGPGAGV